MSLLGRLFENPYTTIASAAGKLGVTPAARTAIERLQGLAVVKEVTGKERNRVYRAHELLSRLQVVD